MSDLSAKSWTIQVFKCESIFNIFKYSRICYKKAIFKKLRCVQIINDFEKSNNIYMCYFCSTKYDKNFIRLNKDSCFLCGCLVRIEMQTTNACYCLRHNKFDKTFFQCFVCKFTLPKMVNPLPLAFKLCLQCGFGNRCCYINLT